jgi:hypothetical protein
MAACITAVFLPNLPHWNTAAIGGAWTDSLKHVWSQWWVVQRLLQDGAIPLEASLIHHPIGGPFFSLDTVNALIGLPLRAVAGPVATYNTVLLLDLVLASWAAAALARTLGVRPWSSAVAGVGFVLSAWVFAFPLASGVSETALFFPLPLALLLLIHTVRKPGWAAPVFASLALALQGLGCWSHGITAGVLIAGGLGCWLLTRPWQAAVGTPSALDRPTAMRLLLFLVLILGLAIPAYLAVSGTVTHAEAVKVREIGVFGQSLLGPLDLPETNSMALVDFVLPGTWGLRTGGAGPEQLYYTSYFGLTLLGLAIIGIRRGGRQERWLGLAVLLMALLATGPRIYLDHSRTLLGLPNPLYLLLHAFFPLFNATLHSVDRLALGAQLPLAILAGRGLDALLSGRPRPTALCMGALAVVLAEALFVSPAPWPLQMTSAVPHPASLALAERPGPGAVLDLPFTATTALGKRFVGDIFYQQTVHSRPIPFQLDGNEEDSLSPPVRANPFYRGLARVLMEGRSAPDACDGAQGLSNLGFVALIWHTDLATEAQRALLEPHLQRCLGQGQVYGDRVVYDLQR